MCAVHVAMKGEDIAGFYTISPSVIRGVGPDSAIGVGRPQMDLIEDFIHDPPAGPVVRFETAGDGHEGHWGF